MAAKGLGFAAFFSSLAQSVPMLYQTEIEAKKRRKGKETKRSAMDILRGFETSYEGPAEPTPEPEAPPPAAAAAPVGVDPTMGMLAAEPPTAMGEVAGTKKGKSRFPNLAETIEKYSKEYGVPIDAIDTVVDIESGGGKYLTSVTGVKGAMQVTKNTAKMYGVGPAERATTEGSIKAGTAHLKYLLKKYQGDLTKAWSAYNTGEAAVDKAVAAKGVGWQGQLISDVKKSFGPHKPKELQQGWKKIKSKDTVKLAAETETTTATGRTEQMKPILTEAMEEIIRQKPKKPVKRTSRAGEKLKHFYQRATPEEVEAAQPMLNALSQLSKVEGDELQREWNRYDKAADRRLRAILTQATIEAGISKAEKTAGRKTTGEQLKKLKAYRSSLQKQMDTFRDISKKYAIAKPSQRKKIESAWPDYFVETDRKLFGKKTEVNELVQSKLQQQIDEVDRMLEAQIGLPSPTTLPTQPESAETKPSPSGPTSKNIKDAVNLWITKKE